MISDALVTCTTALPRPPRVVRGTSLPVDSAGKWASDIETPGQQGSTALSAVAAARLCYELPVAGSFRVIASARWRTRSTMAPSSARAVRRLPFARSPLVSALPPAKSAPITRPPRIPQAEGPTGCRDGTLAWIAALALGSGPARSLSREGGPMNRSGDGGYRCGAPNEPPPHARLPAPRSTGPRTRDIPAWNTASLTMCGSGLARRRRQGFPVVE